MNKSVFSLLLALYHANFPFAQAAENVLPEHLQQIETLHRRAERLAFGEQDANNYHLSKARAWLILAKSEYYEKDSGGTLTAAIGQAQFLLDALESKQAIINMDMPAQVPGSETVRPDLWEKIASLKKGAKFACGQQSIAEAEVYLVWSGHEFYESGLSHAESYMRAVEDRIYSAQVSIDKCNQPAVALSPLMEKITLSSDTMFAFGKSALNASALSKLDELAESIRKVNLLEEVVLVGHTDRLRGDGHPERNQLLSERRAESIKQYLIKKGVPAGLIRASGAGSTQPLVECSAKLSRAKQIACLQPNRRVEITLRGGNAVKASKGFVE